MIEELQELLEQFAARDSHSADIVRLETELKLLRETKDALKSQIFRLQDQFTSACTRFDAEILSYQRRLAKVAADRTERRGRRRWVRADACESRRGENSRKAKFSASSQVQISSRGQEGESRGKRRCKRQLVRTQEVLLFSFSEDCRSPRQKSNQHHCAFDRSTMAARSLDFPACFSESENRSPAASNRYRAAPRLWCDWTRTGSCEGAAALPATFLGAREGEGMKLRPGYGQKALWNQNSYTKNGASFEEFATARNDIKMNTMSEPPSPSHPSFRMGRPPERFTLPFNRVGVGPQAPPLRSLRSQSSNSFPKNGPRSSMAQNLAPFGNPPLSSFSSSGLPTGLPPMGYYSSARPGGGWSNRSTSRLTLNREVSRPFDASADHRRLLTMQDVRKLLS